MSEELYTLGGLRFWTEAEIELREAFQHIAVSAVRRELLAVNKAWTFVRTEGPILTPASEVSAAYDSSDVFATDHVAGGETLMLRAETTASSYRAARRHINMGAKLPLCVWQAGKSFRKETNDGASASKLRFNEFWQLEFQCLYRSDTKADYRASVIESLGREVSRFTREPFRIVPSDRLPAYALSTLDIEVMHKGKWREMASCSIRNDFGSDVLVAEFAVGLDRVATLAAEN